MDGETNGGQEAAQGAQDQAQQQCRAAKNAETAEQLRGKIAELKAQGEPARIDFKLQLVGVRNVKAACALLGDHDNDMDMRPIYAVFRGASLTEDSAASNFEELFKTYSPDTVRRVI